MQLQIEKHLQISFAERFNDRRTCREVELEPNLEPSTTAIETINKVKRRTERREVERYDEVLGRISRRDPGGFGRGRTIHLQNIPQTRSLSCLTDDFMK